MGYTSNNVATPATFPDHFIDPDKKGAQWHLQFSEAIYSYHTRDRGSIQYSKRDEYRMLRLYGNGKQPTEKYMKKFGWKNGQKGEFERKGFMNLDWDIFSPAPKYKQVLISMFNATEYDIMASAIDELSGAEREELKWQTYFDKKTEEFQKKFSRKIGMPPPERQYVPKNLQELEIFDKIGGFKMKGEIAMEKLLKYSFKISDWNQIKVKMLEDFIDLNFAACKDYVDKKDLKVKSRYVDPIDLIMQYSRHFDHHDSNFAGEIFPVSIVDLKKEGNFTDEEIREIAKNNTSYNNYTSGDIDWDNYYVSDQQGGYGFVDDWKVRVMDSEFKTIDRQYSTKRKNKYGETLSYKSKFGKIDKGETRTTKTTDIQVVRKCKWIIGTKYIYDWGVQNDIPRENDSTANLSFHAYRLRGKSITSICLPNYDQLQMAWMKFQNSLAKAKPAGVAVEFNSLTNMTLGGKGVKPLEVLSIHRETGDLIYKASTHSRGGLVMTPNAGKPVQELQGGIGRQLQEFVQIVDINNASIQENTGITPQASGGSVPTEQGLGVSEIAIAATNNALRHLFDGYKDLKENAARNMALRGQILLRHNKEAANGYYPILGNANMEVIKISAEMPYRKYGIMLEMKPDKEMKRKIEEAARVSMQAGKNGQPGLDFDDYLMVSRHLEHGNVKYAEALLAYKIDLKQKEAHAQSQELIDRQAKRNDESKVVETQQKKAQSDIEVKTANEIELFKSKMKDKLDARQKAREAGKEVPYDPIFDGPREGAEGPGIAPPLPPDQAPMQQAG